MTIVKMLKVRAGTTVGNTLTLKTKEMQNIRELKGTLHRTYILWIFAKYSEADFCIKALLGIGVKR